MTKPIIIANWKMNPSTQKEVERLLDSFKIKNKKEVEIVICPPFIYLGLIKDRFVGVPARGGLAFGSQDCFWENRGPYTGEISPAMLKDLGCQYVIIGHSERKKHFNETDEMVNMKIRAVLKARLKPILCVGEEARDSFDHEGRPINEMSLVVKEQLEKALIDISAERIRDITFVYEPVWAISTESGNPCSADDAMKAGLLIRRTLVQLYGRKIAEKARIIYGGSVNSRNVQEYIKGAQMDGVLVGGASLNASEFNKIIEKVNEIS
ncbi:MAG: triose-phosphate isomerase [Candidatus Portnoybacteria bacterium]